MSRAAGLVTGSSASCRWSRTARPPSTSSRRHRSSPTRPRASRWPTRRLSPSVGLTAWQSLFEHADLRAGQRLLVNGAGGAVGGYAVQLAKRADAQVIATASPRSTERVRTAGADEIIDRTTTNVVEAVTEPVDVVLNLAPVAQAELNALAGLVRAGGIVLSTVPTAMPDETADVRAVPVFARSDAGQLAQLVRMVDASELHVDVAERLALSELSAVHARADAGALPGKVVLLPAAA